jgi:hypothetical protein
MSTQRLTEINIRNLPGSKGRPVHKADNLIDIRERREPRRLTTLWTSTACYKSNFTVK